jgi:drug/metabolite transporter (DMT)-like permease
MTALVAFAANSIFCRLALRNGGIDPASFTAIRLASGALMLALLCASGRPKVREKGGWGSGILLFLYALPFAFAYLDLGAGTGALMLFGTVQITMITAAGVGGHRPNRAEWTGIVTAFAGLAYLVSPGVESPSLAGSLLMSVAGIAWGLYTVRGKRSASPLADTAGNFNRATLPALLAGMVFAVAGGTGPSFGAGFHIEAAGAGYALASGMIASGIGYAIWYSALRGLTEVRAAVVQLSVPLITAAAGVMILSEPATFRLFAASVLILGGIGITIAGRARKTPAQQ